MTELISIVIPTYNRAALLPAAVDSARAAGGNVEVVVVDDASTDDTPLVCAGLANTTVIRLPQNKGLAAARNAGIRAASGQIVAFLDDDDARFAGSLDRQLARLREMPEAVLAYGQIKCKNTGQLWPASCPQGDVFWKLLEWNFIPVISVLARRAALLKAGLFDERLRVVEDWDLWLRLAAGGPVAAMDEPVALYTDASAASGQLSSNRVKMSLACASVQQRAMRSARAAAAPRSVRREIRTRLLRRHWFELTLAAAEFLLAEDRKLAGKHLLAALRLQPGWSLSNAGFRSLSRQVFSPGKAADIKAARKRIYADLDIFERLA